MHKSLEAEQDFAKLVTTQSGFKVGVMTKEMLESIRVIHRSADSSYWTSTANSSSNVWYVDYDGNFDYGYSPGCTRGFRPYICVNMGGK